MNDPTADSSDPISRDFSLSSQHLATASCFAYVVQKPLNLLSALLIPSELLNCRALSLLTTGQIGR